MIIQNNAFLERHLGYSHAESFNRALQSVFTAMAGRMWYYETLIYDHVTDRTLIFGQSTSGGGVAYTPFSILGP